MVIGPAVSNSNGLLKSLNYVGGEAVRVENEISSENWPESSVYTFYSIYIFVLFFFFQYTFASFNHSLYNKRRLQADKQL